MQLGGHEPTVQSTELSWQGQWVVDSPAREEGRLLLAPGFVLLGVAGFWNVPLGRSGSTTTQGRLLRIDGPRQSVHLEALVFELRENCVCTSAH